ncbi:hypothetical protein KY316_00260 [Candidatus Woesearchaeota archaeon]|nr:hypothetical protein [Candidatus Woesearchaeota archaeon]
MAERESRRLRGIQDSFDVSIDAIDKALKTIDTCFKYAEKEGRTGIRPTFVSDELDFIGNVAEHIAIMEGIFNRGQDGRGEDVYENELYFYKAGRKKGTLNSRTLEQSSRYFCEFIRKDETYKNNALTRMFAEKIERLYEKITCRKLFPEVVRA